MKPEKKVFSLRLFPSTVDLLHKRQAELQHKNPNLVITLDTVLRLSLSKPS